MFFKQIPSRFFFLMSKNRALQKTDSELWIINIFSTTSTLQITYLNADNENTLASLSNVVSPEFPDHFQVWFPLLIQKHVYTQGSLSDTG